MIEEYPFIGFPEKGLRFLSGLKKNNNREWFESRKGDYREAVAEPALAFVVALGRRLQSISKGIIYDTRMNGSGSVMRIYRDTRFSKDKTPYKDWLGVFFWEGKLKKMENPGYYVHVDPAGSFVGAGHYHFPKQFMEAYREAVVNPKTGKELEDIVKRIDKTKGLLIGGEKTKRAPRGYDADHPRVELLKYKGLYAYTDSIPRKRLTTPDFVDLCYDGCKKMSPLQNWMVKVAKKAR
jgi:uncharacterized protein (TIGR02453 family)